MRLQFGGVHRIQAILSCEKKECINAPNEICDKTTSKPI